MKKLIAGLAAAGLGIAGVAAAAAPAAARPAAPAPNIVSVALTVNSAGSPYEGQFDTLITAATCAYFDGAIVDTLTARGQRTLFAPTDDAFASLGLDPSNVCSAFSATPEVLADVLQYHVTNGARDAASVYDASQLRMLNGDAVLSSTNGVLTDGLGRKANVIVTDVPASNGVIHAIDSVLLPPGFGQ